MRFGIVILMLAGVVAIYYLVATSGNIPVSHYDIPMESIQ